MNRAARKAFTLIEVMVAVMIISVVLMALLKMQGNTTHIFSKLDDKSKINQYTSFFISNHDYGFEKDNFYLDEVLSDFRVEDDLRRELKKIKIELDYERLRELDMREDDGLENSSSMIYELGKTTFKLDNSSSYMIRFKIQ